MMMDVNVTLAATTEIRTDLVSLIHEALDELDAVLDQHRVRLLPALRPSEPTPTLDGADRVSNESRLRLVLIRLRETTSSLSRLSDELEL
jgi:hypothetical protein